MWISFTVHPLPLSGCWWDISLLIHSSLLQLRVSLSCVFMYFKWVCGVVSSVLSKSESFFLKVVGYITEITSVITSFVWQQLLTSVWMRLQRLSSLCIILVLLIFWDRSDHPITLSDDVWRGNFPVLLENNILGYIGAFGGWIRWEQSSLSVRLSAALTGSQRTVGAPWKNQEQHWCRDKWSDYRRERVNMQVADLLYIW